MAVVVSVVLVACNHDAYNTGDSRYSYLRTDFSKVYTNADARLWSAMTDNGDSLLLITPTTAAWATTPDSVYRALLYYNLQQDEDSTTVPHRVEAVAVAMVYVLQPHSATDSLASMTDPMVFQSAWVSSNKQYVNFSLALMTGEANVQDARQTIGLVCDSMKTETQNRHTYYYRLCHRQGDVPQYYKSTLYVSIPTGPFRQGDRVVVSVPTYDGTVTRVFVW